MSSLCFSLCNNEDKKTHMRLFFFNLLILLHVVLTMTFMYLKAPGSRKTQKIFGDSAFVLFSFHCLLQIPLWRQRSQERRLRSDKNTEIAVNSDHVVILGFLFYSLTPWASLDSYSTQDKFIKCVLTGCVSKLYLSLVFADLLWFNLQTISVIFWLRGNVYCFQCLIKNTVMAELW